MKWRILRMASLGLGVSLLAACESVPTNQTPVAPPGARTTTHRLKIGHVAGVSLTDAKADAILAAATRALRGIDSTGDSPADAIMVRSGAVRAIGGPSVINSALDFSKLRSSGVNIAIVNGINDCGGFVPNIVGCAPVPGSFMAVVRLSSLEEVLWAHEFGHNRGLHHRADSTAIMHPQIGSQRRSLLRSEAARFENNPQDLQAAGRASSATVADDGPPPATLAEYLDRTYLHGIPFAHVERFGPAHVPRLKSILSNSGNQKLWANAAVALAAVATPEAIDAVKEFIFKGRGILSPEAYQAKRAAVMALGYAVQQALQRGSAETRQEALGQLRDGLACEYWAQRLKWRAPGESSAAQTAAMCSDTSFAGLALSGAGEAAPWFGEAARQHRPEEGRGQIASKAREEFDKVRALGLRLYTDWRHRHAR